MVRPALTLNLWDGALGAVMVLDERYEGRQEDGASAVEYGLLVAAIAGVLVAILFVVGTIVDSQYDRTCKNIANGDQNTTTDAASCDA